VKEFSVFAAKLNLPQHTMAASSWYWWFIPKPGQTADGALRTEISRRNGSFLNYKRSQDT